MSAQSYTLSLLTVLMSGVVSAIVTYTLNSRDQERHFRRAKAEELFGHLHEYILSLEIHYINYISGMVGKRTLPQILDATIDHFSTSQEKHHQKIVTIVSIHFPSLHAQLDEIFLRRTNSNKYISEYERRYKLGNTETPDLIDPLNREIKELRAAEQRLKSLVAKEAQSRSLRHYISALRKN